MMLVDRAPAGTSSACVPGARQRRFERVRVVVLNGVTNRSRGHLVFAFDSAHVRDVRCINGIRAQSSARLARLFFSSLGCCAYAKVGVDGDLIHVECTATSLKKKKKVWLTQFLNRLAPISEERRLDELSSHQWRTRTWVFRICVYIAVVGTHLFLLLRPVRYARFSTSCVFTSTTRTDSKRVRHKVLWYTRTYLAASLGPEMPRRRQFRAPLVKWFPLEQDPHTKTTAVVVQ